jgi:hypothetical protein
MKQRQKLVLLIILSFLCIPTFAQRAVSKPDRLLPKIGVKAGLTLSDFSETDVNNKMNIGFHTGVFAEIPLSEHFSLEGGLHFTTKGCNYTNDDWYMEFLDVYGSYYEEYKLYYLDLPITFKSALEFSGIKLYGAVGPYLGIGIGGHVYWELEENLFGTKWDETEKSDLKQFDYGLVMGAGIGFKKFQLGCSYYLGLANISSESDTKINNRVIQISLAYKFGKIE